MLKGGTMKRIWIMGLTLIFIGIWNASLEARKMDGDDLSNLIIEGENRLKVHGDIPPLNWTPNIYKDLPNIFQNSDIVSDLKAPALSKPALSLPRGSRSTKTASPWLDRIYEPPVLTLTTKPSKTVDKKVNWIFRVKDSQGKLFFEKKKKSILPRKIEWDGFGKKKTPIQVGYDYSYMLSIIDEAGNPQRYAGSPFNMKSFRYRKGGKSITMLHPESVFLNASSFKFSKNGVRFLTEIKDFIRRRFGKTIEITLYDRDLKFGMARATNIARFFIKALEYPEDRIEIQALPPSQGQGYRYVEIVAK
ncbi:hypothetical protein BVX98_01450 [bacterium F11]|nr:hypothetical protein BVX98_01450 [bacterium F11]